MKVVLKKSDAVEPFTFSFISDAGKTIVRSENYKSKSNAQKGIESVKKNSQSDVRYELLKSKNGKPYFNLKATNGRIVATSTMFATLKIREEAMALLKSQAADTVTEEV